ncbi:hypothetical protein CK203_016786 [Vitis vinifera]|uniref:Uncharacterized protein n=1 Tax=Vitis vinifera TaxID=29760 RepID=A0A438J213_VITVI|nr:hypothetical protein CK203_016786 [Vitis vinifera]
MLVECADCLRYKTALKIMEILNPSQNVKFLLAITGFSSEFATGACREKPRATITTAPTREAFNFIFILRADGSPPLVATKKTTSGVRDDHIHPPYHPSHSPTIISVFTFHAAMTPRTSKLMLSSWLGYTASSLQIISAFYLLYTPEFDDGNFENSPHFTSLHKLSINTHILFIISDRESAGALRGVLRSQTESGARGRADLVRTTIAHSLRAKPPLDWWVQARARVSAGDKLYHEPDGAPEAKDGASEGGDSGGGEGADGGAGEDTDEAPVISLVEIAARGRERVNGERNMVDERIEMVKLAVEMLVEMDGHVILNTQGVLDSAVAPAKGIRTGCPDAPSDGYVSHGALSSYEWLSETMVGDAAVRDRGKRLCRMIVGSDLLSLPLTIYIRMDHADYPDVLGDYLGVYALPASFALPWIERLKRRLSFLEGFRIG